jgi:formate C-acetyltransferase
VFTKYRKSHNDGVFDAYTPEILAARRSGIVTGLPDAYGRGRIIGDYRRVALYGVDRLLEVKKAEKAALNDAYASEAVIRDREELSEQIRALQELKEMAAAYGYDISGPAATAREAIQWLYFGYLAAVKEQNGAAMSLGRTSTFLDVYLQRDLDEGLLSEADAQELIDDFVIKLRIVRFLRTKEYDALFSGDPTWVTEVIGGVGLDGRPLVTRTSFRFLQTLRNLGPAPEPNLTVFWSPELPDGFKRFCAELSIETSSIQYESDELIRPTYGDDTGIACCVSAMEMGKQMQFFGARVNLAKCLLYALNGGRDEITGVQVGPEMEPVQGDVLDVAEVRARFERMMDWLADVYVNAMNVIHYMHDKYAYERIEMALHDYDPQRTMAFGVAGLSVAADSLSAIQHAQVRPIRDESGLIVDFETSGEFPTFGNHDDRVDAIASDLLATFMGKLRERPTYRDAVHTQSVLTITSNVVYGKVTGSTPDGRQRGEPFAPGANPMHGRDEHGFLASALSVAKLPYEHAQDGISFTASLVPHGLGATRDEQVTNLANVLDAYFSENGFHVNINVLDRETLLDAMERPEAYPQLTIRVSGYAVNFVKLTREQQLDVVNRTFHGQV